MSTEKEYGLIYVLTNDCMPGLVKIGQTTRTDLGRRMRELYSTGVPVKFESAASCKVPLDKLDMVEQALHRAFGKLHVGTHEFFRISPEEVKPLLNAMETLAGLKDATDEVQQEIDKAADDVEAEEAERRKLPNMDFFNMNLHPGDTLTFIREPYSQCTIVSNKTVDFGEMHDVSLSSVTRQLLNYTARPAPFWRTADGRLLIDLYTDYVRTCITDAQARNDAVALQADDIKQAFHATLDKLQPLTDTNHAQ